ncbi:histidine phosphatase family protein [Fredinandcohnia humi]
MTVVCLVRHGETAWNAIERIQGRTDIPLNEVGIKQAEACREYFREHRDWDVLFSSTLTRAKQTAEIINEGLNLPFYQMEDFVEISFGEAEGMTIEERRSTFPNGISPNEEPNDVLLGRVFKGLSNIQREYPKQRVILVAHGGVINAILEHLSNGELGYGKSKLDNASLSHIFFDEGSWKLLDYNQVSHLSTLHVV